MKKLLTILSIFWLTASGMTIYAGADGGTWSGEVVDLVCYVGSGARGPGHSGCAKSCAKTSNGLNIFTLI